MFLRRKTLARIAALALVLWVFAAGAAFANACATSMDMLECDQCCTEVKAPVLRVDTTDRIVLPAPGDLPPLPAPPLGVAPRQLQADTTRLLAQSRASPPRQRIPIEFLRLAL